MREEKRCPRKLVAICDAILLAFWNVENFFVLSSQEKAEAEGGAMKDIEDAGADGDQPSFRSDQSANARGSVNPRTRNATERSGQDVPGDATVFVHTFGCGHNVSDGEYMAGQLVEGGYRVTDNFSAADCYLINSCTVKNPSEEHFVTMLKRAKQTGKPVIVAGCVPQGDQNNAEWADVSVVGVRQIDKVGQVVSEALRGNTVRLLSDDATVTAAAGADGGGRRSGRSLTSDHLPSLNIPKIRRNKYVEIIPINVGCLNNCTYCKTKHARGDLKSWPVEEIVGRVRDVLREGQVQEIRITSEDVGAYGIDIGTDIVTLLREILQVLDRSHVMLRIGMSNPPYLLRHIKEFARLLMHPNCFEFVHIPVQSGDNSILDVMKREYTVEEFVQCVDGIRAVAPLTSVATDIICAFPGEGEKEWENTLKLVRQVQFPVLNISRFYPRRGTPAAAMKQIPSEVAKHRTAEITTLYNSYHVYDHLIGTEHVVTLIEVAHDKHHLVGHTKGYVQVLVDPSVASLGDRIAVRITAAGKYSVTGTRIDLQQMKSESKRESDRSLQPSAKSHTILIGIVAVVGTALVLSAILNSVRKLR